MNAEVYLNGKKLGVHPYGYTAFAFDITDGLICDGKTENVIVVKTNNKIPSSRWYSGSGIYRDVQLTVTNKVHVGYNGTQLIAKDLENTKDSVVKMDVIAKVENNNDVPKTVTIKNTLRDQQGNIASRVASQEVQLSAKSTKDILDGEEIIDTYHTDYGFRYFNFDKNNGFSLNGKNMKLKGVCMHHDQGALGAVANRDAIERQIKILKEMGCNSIRVTHNPAASSLIDVCNEYGILVINEAFDGWTEYKNGNVNDYGAYFNQTIDDNNQIINGENGMKWAEFDIKAMINSCKNDHMVQHHIMLI